MMAPWINMAKEWLQNSLSPLPQELNAIDWKSGISSKSDRLAQHLSAFSNQEGGGYLAYGINNDGSPSSLAPEEAEVIIQKLGNIARNSLSEALTIDHEIIDHLGFPLLFIRIPEGRDKPVHLRGNDIYASYKRSAGQTVKMSRQDVATMIASSSGQSFEEAVAVKDLTSDDVLSLLDWDSYFQLMKVRIPETKSTILEKLKDEGIVIKTETEKWAISNMGALLFARDMPAFQKLKLKTPRVIVYWDNTRIRADKDIEGKKGYASGFEGLIDYIMDKLPSSEIIAEALRKEEKMYPKVAIRELVANALVHQDFTLSGQRIMIEIFTDRIEITNPGIPLVDTNRFIDTPPRSRNETMANMMRRLRICELRGSGVDRTIEAIEEFGLPAPKFIREEDYTRVVIYAPMSLERMSIEDRARACYQHTCLHYINNQMVNNTSIRKRFGISKNNYTMASKILSDTIAAGLIKLADPDNASKKYANYIPYWA